MVLGDRLRSHHTKTHRGLVRTLVRKRQAFVWDRCSINILLRSLRFLAINSIALD